MTDRAGLTSRRARIVALWTMVAIAWGWVALLVWAPRAGGAAERSTGAGARLVYLAGGVLCHQRPERSFASHGVPLPVCARCTGLYVGGAVGCLLAALWRPSRVSTPAAYRRALLAAAVPTIATVAIEWTGAAAMENTLRALAALPVATVAGWMLGVAVVAPGAHGQSDRHAERCSEMRCR
jgi:uncharacterized membrane protein